jgi:uncharacterized GH25 family protein
VPDCGVRIYRGALDSVLPADFDVFAPESNYVPNYIAGEVRTATDGTWQLTGVWPRAFYLMLAGIGTDAPMHQILTKTPSPGEIVDLGDIVLPLAGVITGVVVDDNGDPLAGALVRAVDLPGALAAFFPVERFDPEGAVLVREQSFPAKVVAMPSWVKRVFDDFPIPSTTSGADGQFRLVGVVPGSNLLATTAKGFLSDVKPSVQVRAGQEKDVGKVRMKRGEELVGKVVDTAGKPVADAEVFAGSTITVAPVDMAQKLARTDANGQFTGTGFAPGRVTVAARRGAGHAWTLAEPQSVLGEVVVTLPASFGCEVAVTLADGKPAKAPRFQLLQGKAGQGAVEMHMMGFLPPIDLRERKQELAEGRWRLQNLAPGSYTLITDAPGHAIAFASFDLVDADTKVALQLEAPKVFTVRVLADDDKPVRNALIWAQAEGRSFADAPVQCGRTDADGVRKIDSLVGESLRVSAEHPKWGAVSGEVKLGEELVLRMQPPGSLHVVVTEAGKPPELGKYTIGVMRQRNGEPRGPLEHLPTMMSPGLDGTFTMAAVQPGKYEISAIKALDTLRSPGGMMALAQDMFLMRGREEVEVDVVSGQRATAQLETGEKPLEGPTAQLIGSVMVDGKVAVGQGIIVYQKDTRLTARTDERGRFTFAAVPAGELTVTVLGSTDGGLFSSPGSTIWSGSLTLKEAELRDLTIEVLTTSVRGVCYLPDGTPAAGLFVQARGKLKGSERRNQVWLGAPTNSQGEFVFSQVAEGKWSLQVDSNGEESPRGKLAEFETTGGVPVAGLRIDLQAPTVVRGTIDLAALGSTKPRWVWLQFELEVEGATTPDRSGRSQYAGVEMEPGTFHTDDLEPGRYRVTLHASAENASTRYACDFLVVPVGGIRDAKLRVGARIEK